MGGDQRFGRLERWFIYVLRDPISWDVRYVGKTNDPVARLYGHMHETATKTHYAGRWIGSLKRKGLKPFLEVIDAGCGDGHGPAERAWIKEYRRRGARLTNTGDGGEGFCDTPEVREKISRARRGKSQPKVAAALRGRRLPPEVIAKISAAKTGKKQSPETIEKRAAALRGRKRDPEIGRKISAAKLGFRHSEETKARLAEAQTGRRYSEEARANMRAAQKLRRAQEAEARKNAS